LLANRKYYKISNLSVGAKSAPRRRRNGAICENSQEPDSFRVTGNPKVMLARQRGFTVLRGCPEVLFGEVTWTCCRRSVVVAATWWSSSTTRVGRFTAKWRCQCGCRMLAGSRGTYSIRFRLGASWPVHASHHAPTCRVMQKKAAQTSGGLPLFSGISVELYCTSA
jgi:hypothetical protein